MWYFKKYKLCEEDENDDEKVEDGYVCRLWGTNHSFSFCMRSSMVKVNDCVLRTRKVR